MVKIRLTRTGRHKLSLYRIVVTDSRSPRDGRFIEQIGHYDPNTNPPTVVIDESKVFKWLNDGARPSDTVKTILTSQGLLAKFKDSKK